MSFTASLRDDDRLAVPVFLAIVAIAGLLMAGIVPPFQVADEPAHFFRAVALSEGVFTTTIHDGQKGAWLPVWSVSLATNLLEDFSRRDTKTSLEQIRTAAPRDVADAGKTFVPVGGPAIFDRLRYTAATYTPAPYVASTAAIAAGKRIGLSPLQLFYAGRVANLLLASALVLLALRVAPFGRWVIALVALTPMSLQLLASYSADSLTISASMLMIAATLRWLQDRGRAAALLMILGTILVCLCKPNCAFVLLPYVALFQRGEPDARGVLAAHAAALLGGAATTIYWARDGASLTPQEGYSASAQIAHIIDRPTEFFETMVRTIQNLAVRYEIEFVGKLGWLDLELPIALIVGSYLLLIIMSATTSRRFNVSERLILFGFFMASAFATFLIAYAMWNRVGAGFIGAVQGRYFLPAAPLLFLSLSGTLRLEPKSYLVRNWLAALASAAALGVAILHVFNHYYR